jgi:hypothetical protein
MRGNKIIQVIIILIMLLQCSLAFAQASSLARIVPEGFSTIRLGMDIERVKELLINDPNFSYRGDPDVSMLLRPQESVIDTAGRGYISRGVFTFYQGTLYSISLSIDLSRMDHYSIYTTLINKYGRPDELDNRTSIWRNEIYEMILERPLKLKYIYLPSFTEILNSFQEQESLEKILREDFLEQL